MVQEVVAERRRDHAVCLRQWNSGLRAGAEVGCQMRMKE